MEKPVAQPRNLALLCIGLLFLFHEVIGYVYSIFMGFHENLYYAYRIRNLIQNQSLPNPFYLDKDWQCIMLLILNVIKIWYENQWIENFLRSVPHSNYVLVIGRIPGTSNSTWFSCFGKNKQMWFLSFILIIWVTPTHTYSRTCMWDHVHVL